MQSAPVSDTAYILPVTCHTHMREHRVTTGCFHNVDIFTYLDAKPSVIHKIMNHVRENAIFFPSPPPPIPVLLQYNKTFWSLIRPSDTSAGKFRSPFLSRCRAKCILAAFYHPLSLAGNTLTKQPTKHATNETTDQKLFLHTETRRHYTAN
jgi:hypothetical protein